MKKMVLLAAALVLAAAVGFLAGVAWMNRSSSSAGTPEGDPPASLSRPADPGTGESSQGAAGDGASSGPAGGSGLPDLDKMTDEEKKAYFGEIVDKEVQDFLDQIERKDGN